MDNKPNIDETVDKLLNDELETNASYENVSKEDIFKESKDTFRLPSGSALTLKETYEITASENTKIIVLVGPSACGKTTIETTLYQMFQTSEVGDYYFAGSKTLQGYEQRSYYTRTKSKQNQPMTPRTSRGVQETFLHLKLWNYKDNVNRNFLFSDLSGEDFKSHIADTEAMKRDYYFIKSADYIIGIFDGESITKKKERQGVFEEMAQLLRTIHDAGLTSKNTKLQIVFSKYDIISNYLLKTPEIKGFIDNKKNELQQRLDFYNEINFFNVAAMPFDNTSFEVGYGIKELMTSWDVKKSTSISSLRNDKPSDCMHSEFNKLYYKIFGENNE